MDERLARTFFDRPTVIVARELLGQRLSGLIVETEAYAGPDDQASHAFRKPGGRAAIMFGPPGFAYVYVIYGHHCLNIVTEGEGFPAAVLIRGLWPEEGIEEMRRLRGIEPSRTAASTADRRLTNGPGNLCRALAIDLSCNGVDMVTSDLLFVAAGPGFPDARVRTGPRVGVRGDALALTRAWRFYVTV